MEAMRNRCRAEKLVVNFLGEQAHESFLVLKAANDFVAGRPLGIGPVLHVAMGVEDVASFVEQLVGRIDLRFCHALASRFLWLLTLTQDDSWSG